MNAKRLFEPTRVQRTVCPPHVVAHLVVARLVVVGILVVAGILVVVDILVAVGIAPDFRLVEGAALKAACYNLVHSEDSLHYLDLGTYLSEIN